MDWLSSETLSALAAIIVIDLVLAGDNAIVIALAARRLPRAQRRRAIAWGTLGAIAVRIAMTACVVWLLKVPGLMFAGGLILVWIALKLLAPAANEGDPEMRPADGFWGALRTIVIADAAMGLDNVLAVAGAAQGSIALVAAGLAISIPIVVWGSTLVLAWLERFPSIVYLGAGVLGWTAAQMVTGEPLLRAFFEHRGAAPAAVQVLVVGGILAAGYFRNRRAQAFAR